MIDTQISIRRGSGLWGGVSPESVKRYQEELEELKKKLSDFDFLYERNLFGGGLKKALAAEIEQEVKYCLFYEEFGKRQNEPDFGKWVFKTKEEVNAAREYWRAVSGDQWTKTNGRVKAIIQFDKSGIMVKIILSYENDSTNLKFYEKPYNDKDGLAVVHLKSEASIQTKLQYFQSEADAFLADHLYPLYSQNEAQLLRQLLHIEEERL
jgi:hypothetical protein